MYTLTQRELLGAASGRNPADVITAGGWGVVRH